MWSPIVEALNSDKERIDERIKGESLLEKLSLMYRTARKERSNVQELIRELTLELSDKKIIHSRYMDVSNKIEQLHKELDRLESYSNGIFDARELLL